MPLITRQAAPEEGVRQGRRERNKQLTRDKILRAALILFQRSGGVAATSMDEIAELAEVSDTTVYNYFKTKDELVDAFVEELAGAPGLTAQLAQRPANESPFVAFRKLLELAEVTDEDLQSRRELLQRVRADKVLWGAYLRGNELYADELGAAFETRAPAWGPEKARTAAHATAGALQGLLDLQHDESSAESWRAAAIAVVRRLEKGWRS